MTVAYQVSVRAMLENPGLFITDEIVATACVPASRNVNTTLHEIVMQSRIYSTVYCEFSIEHIIF